MFLLTHKRLEGMFDRGHQKLERCRTLPELDGWPHVERNLGRIDHHDGLRRGRRGREVQILDQKSINSIILWDKISVII